MKSLFSIFFSLYLMNATYAQVFVKAVGSCNSITATLSGPSLDSNVWFSDEFDECPDINSDCCRKVKAEIYRFETQYYLFRSDGLFISGPQSSPTFNNLPHGEYYIHVLVGVPKTCSDGSFTNLYKQIDDHTLLFQGLVGKKAGADSNKVPVGKTTPNNNQFWTTTSSNIQQFSEVVNFQCGQEVFLMDGSSAYNKSWIAIFENGGDNRWESTYWVDGKNTSAISLTALWKKNHPNWVFEPGLTYTVQHVVENGQCFNDPWNQKDKNFTMLNCFTDQLDDRFDASDENEQQIGRAHV